MKKSKKKTHQGIKLAGLRDRRLLMFLWKWKVATTAVLLSKFFSNRSSFTGFRRLWKLEKGSFIRSHADSSGQKYIWTLEERGFDFVKENLPYTLQELGYKSENKGHDLLVLAFHTGDFLLETPGGVEIVSEQQLRRCDIDSLPDWLPKMRNHRPDGYTRITNNKNYQIFSIEVEINVKKRDFYYDVARSYEKTNCEVLWLVPTVSAGRNILQHLSRCDANYNKRHSFVSFQKFKECGWEAIVEIGQHEGKSIREVFIPDHQNYFKTESKPVLTELALNVTKTPHKSKSYQFYELGNFSN